MGRGKIEIKWIKNATNRQVTYSKRRTGIMKKARELTVLCDAQVAIIMFSSTSKYHEFCSPGTDIKGIFDRYQQAIGTSLWIEQYENMQRTLSHLKDINRNLRTEIRQRMGEDLDGLEFNELRGLEQNVDTALKEVRQRKYHVITTQTETYKKKVKHSQEAYKNLHQELGMREDPAFGFVDNPAMGGGTAWRRWRWAAARWGTCTPSAWCPASPTCTAWPTAAPTTSASVDRADCSIVRRVASVYR